MTPELRQAITILQLSALELGQYVEKQLLENPLLEMSDEGFREDEGFRKTKEDTKDIDTIDWEEYFQDCSDADFMRFPQEKKDEQVNYENFVSSTPSLHEHLMMQLHLTVIPKTLFKIGEFLIGNIDRRGYLTVDTKDAAKLLKVPQNQVEEALKIIQGFEPAGVGARNLQECLLIQVEQQNIQNPKIKDFIQNHLNDLAEARYSRIAEALNISLTEVQELKDIVLSLDPKPGRNFSSVNDTHYIVPDASVKKIGDEYIVIMNDSVAPRLSINTYYRSLLSSENNESILKFLNHRLDSALWLIKSIEQRRQTLYNVIKSIVDVQKEFLDYGITYLKPLTLKTIADKIGVHESTVSRAVNGKYVQTPRGVFELKFFFKNGLGNINGSATSSESIKKMIKEMISSENPYHPLSDQKIADLLKKNGIIISRRTVAKYREEIGIPSSAKRKRY